MQGIGNSLRYLYVRNYQHRTWFDRVIEKIKRVQFFLPHRVFLRYHWQNYAYWLLCLGLMQATWAA